MAAATLGALLAPVGGTNASAGATPVNRDKVGVSLYGNALSWSQHHLDHQMRLISQMGAEWVRVPFNWATLEMHGRGKYNWGPADRVVASARAHGLSVMANVAYTPGWARRAGRPGTDPPTKVGYFGSFLYQAALRYAPKGVHRWEIWNEPNLQSMWTPRPDPVAYTNLLKAGYTALKKADRRAVVITGGLSPGYDAPDHTQMAPLSFLVGMYRAGAHGSFDQVGIHPYSFPYRSTYDASWNPFQQAVQLHDLMTARGDGDKRVCATEVGFPTGTDSVAVSEAKQGPYLVEGIRAWLARSFSAPVFVYSIADQGSTRSDYFQNFGLVRWDGTQKPAYDTVRTALRG